MATLNLDHLARLLRAPTEFLPAFESALSEAVRIRHKPEKHDIEGKIYHAGFRGSFGDHHVNPRTLRATHLGQMVSVEGIVTRCELPVPGVNLDTDIVLS